MRDLVIVRLDPALTMQAVFHARKQVCAVRMSRSDMKQHNAISKHHSFVAMRPNTAVMLRVITEGGLNITVRGQDITDMLRSSS